MTVRNLVLVGFMGTGKSTIGKKLAERLHWRFIDADAAIEANQGTSIPEIFRLQGEAYFRKVESQVLAGVLTGACQVVATGGGAVLAQENRDCMLANSFVVGLKASAEAIIDRVSQDTNRPLLQGNLEERVHTLLESRKTAYDFAHVTIDTTALTVEQIVEEIVGRMS
ncbi:shikimate kinase [Paenibacillus ferrarius]|uniref:shikimate kinase n=1 Tax=Paenibacillus ferrarius TaxID=1469647 RepID=UPI003D27FE79